LITRGLIDREYGDRFGSMPDEKKQNKRDLVRLVGAAFVGELADEVMAAVQEERKRQGLPPLTD
jgi:hypothetical protein